MQNSRLALAVTCRIHGWPWLLYDEATGRATCLAARWFCTGPLARHPRAIGVRTPRRGTGRVDGASSGGAGQAGTAAATVPPGTCGLGARTAGDVPPETHGTASTHERTEFVTNQAEEEGGTGCD